MVGGIDALEIEPVARRNAQGGEFLFEKLRHDVKSRPCVEGVALAHDSRTTPSGAFVLLNHGDRHARSSQVSCRREAARPGPDHDGLAWLHGLPLVKRRSHRALTARCGKRAQRAMRRSLEKMATDHEPW